MYRGDWFLDKVGNNPTDELSGYQILMNYAFRYDSCLCCSSLVDWAGLESLLANLSRLSNYAFRHPDAPSMYLIPYGYEVNNINHNKTLANVRLRWARDGEMGHKQRWLENSPSEMQGMASPGLFLDYVATKDIQPGEEIFLVCVAVLGFGFLFKS